MLRVVLLNVGMLLTSANLMTIELEELHDLALNASLGRNVIIELDAERDEKIATDAVYRQEIAETAAEWMGCEKVTAKRLFREAGKHEADHQAFGLHLWYRMCESDDEDEEAAAIHTYASIENILVHPHTNDPDMRLPIKLIEAEIRVTSDATTSDPLFRVQKNHYDMIHLEDAWDVTMGDEDVVVQVLDTGIAPDQPDIFENVWQNPNENCGNGIDDDNNGYVDDCLGYNFANDRGGTDMTGLDRHGAHVSGTISAVNDNGIGVAGIAGGNRNKPGTKIMIAVGFGTDGRSGGFPEAIVYGADNGAHISSNSWSYTSPNAYANSVKTAIEYWNHVNGPLIVFAAGNRDDEKPYYPGAFSNTVSVAALATSHARASFSNYGTWIDMAAPGVNIYSLKKEDHNAGYGYMSGTSMACPHVSGVLALGLSVFGPDGPVSKEDILDCAYASANDIGFANQGLENKLGAGLIDAQGVVNCVYDVGTNGKPTHAPTTSQPSPKPTFVTDSKCNIFKIVDGGGDASGDSSSSCPNHPDKGRPDVIEVDPNEELGGVRCCNQAGTDADSFCDSSCQLVTFMDAKATCESEGMRLCTEQELRRGIAAGTGCRYDKSFVWSEPQCPTPEPTYEPTAHPTPEPVPSPTFTPTDSPPVVCEYRLVDGGGAQSTDASTTCPMQPDKGRPDVLEGIDPSSQVGGLRCCELDGSDGDSFCDTRCQLFTFTEAEERCEEKGMRLCTEEETLNGVVKGTGCSYDKSYIWIKPQCQVVLAPTPEPTSEKDACSFKLVDGGGLEGPDSSSVCTNRPDLGEDDVSEGDPEAATGGIRCCDGKGGGTSFCSQDCELFTFSQAKQTCEDNGLRLCSEEELLDGVAADTGCNYDYTSVWAAEECTCGMLLVDGSPSKDRDRCYNFLDEGKPNVLYGNQDYSLGGTRCCNDDGSKGDSFCSHACELVPFDTAVDTCEKHNMRLCTKEEVLANKVAGTGCSYDLTFVWTSSEGCTA